MSRLYKFILSIAKGKRYSLKLLFLTFACAVPICSMLIIPAACKHSVAVVGNFSWTYFAIKYPLAQTPITVISQNGEESKTATTDDNGKATFVFSNNPGKITVIATLKNNYFLFQSSCGVNEVRKIQTSAGPFSSIPEGGVNVNFGSHPEAPIWKTLIETGDKLVNERIIPARVKICTTHGSIGYNPKTKVIAIPNSKADSPDAINHEYGHAIMDQFIPVPLVSTCSHKHLLGVETSEQCAFVEGWADFFSIFGKAERYASEVIIFNEKEMEKYSSKLIYLAALKDEGRVAAGLWDLFDTHNDSNTSNNPDLGNTNTLYSDENSNSPISMLNFIDALAKTDTLTFASFKRRLFKEITYEQSYYAKSILVYDYLSGN